MRRSFYLTNGIFHFYTSEIWLPFFSKCVILKDIFPKALFIIFFPLSFLEGNSQNTDLLDDNNGFKKFKFGMTVSQFSKIKENPPSPVKQKDEKIYTYTGEDIQDFHGVRIESIQLSFFKNKLYQIKVSFGSLFREYTVGEESALMYGLRANFGVIVHNCGGSDTKILSCNIWDGRKVRLEHLRIDHSVDGKKKNERYNYILGYLLFTHKGLQKQQQDSELDE